MRERKTIVDERDRYTTGSTWESRAYRNESLIIELLLDIRDLLTKETK